MLQKIIFESLSPKSSNTSTLLPKYSFQNSQLFSNKILSSKYSKFEYSYSLFCTNNLIFNEKCRIVARFKDYLVLDDSTEFLRRFYLRKELLQRLKKIFNFYESYCKIFPNYMILPESQFLYRNIRKKQKMIDAFNEIKKEEEENRKHLKIGLSDDKKKSENVVFTKKIQESIERYHPSLSNILSNTFMSEINNNINNEFDFNTNDKSLITISLSSQRPINLINDINKEVSPFENKFITPNVGGSFIKKNFNDYANNSQNSIFKIVQILNNNKNINDNALYLNNGENDNNIIKPNKKEIKISKNKTNSKKKNNNINNNIKPNAKKHLNINTNTNSNNQININNNNNLKTINVINKHNRVKTNLNNSNNKKKKQEINVNTKKKFISHKQNISVPLAANMLNSNNDNHNINNIIETDNNTIKIINNINNIIINEDKNKTINNGMIININNNYFQVKDTKHIQNNLIKRVKSKEENSKKEKSKEGKKFKEKNNKETEFQKYKIFREKRTYTTYNEQNNSKNNKKFLINEIQSPNNKKEKYQNTETKRKNENSKKYILTMNEIKSSNNTEIYRNLNFMNETNKKPNKKLIENKTLVTSPNLDFKKNKNKKNLINSNNTAITEANTTISTSYNHSKIGNKLISMNKNMKDMPKLEGVESVDKKKLSINRKIVNNYLTATQKKKTFQGRFHVHENSESNTFSNKQIAESNINNNINNNDKIDFINICNSLEHKNNPIKFKLNKKELLKKKVKTNSLQINDKNEFLSSFNLPKEKAHKKDLELDLMNIEEKMVKYRKKSLKKLINNKTQTNSEAELIKDMNRNNPILNTITSKSIKKEKILKKTKQSNLNNKTNIEKDKPESTKEVKKLNAKEMKEKYHKLLRGNKFNHGSYDIANRIHLFKKFKGLNNLMGNMTTSINNTINVDKNKRSPFMKKSVLSPSERIQNTLSNIIKTPIKNRMEKSKENATIEVTNLGKRFKFIGKENKNMDSNNKKMKFLKK